MLSFSPGDVLDEIWDLIESVSEGCPFFFFSIECKLSWKSHIDAVTKRANKTRAFLRKKSFKLPKRCYGHKSIVRPQLEYASTVWDPVTKSNNAKLKSVQRRAAKFNCNEYPESAVSLQCCKSLVGSTFNQGKIKTK